MRYCLFVLLFIFTGQVTTAVAKVEIWECDWHDQPFEDGDKKVIYKIDTKKSSIHQRIDGKWIKYFVEYDKENDTFYLVNDFYRKGEMDTGKIMYWDLVLKKNIAFHSEYDCKVIGP